MTSVHILGSEPSRKRLGGDQPKEDEKVADKEILLVGNTLTEKFTGLTSFLGYDRLIPWVKKSSSYHAVSRLILTDNDDKS